MASVNLSPLFNGQTMLGPTGALLAGGQLFTYQAGSSTPLATYTTSNGNIANQNPIILGTDGKLPNEMWLQAGYSYKFVLEDANSTLIDTYDNIAGIITSVPSTSPSVPSGCILIWSGAVGSIPTGFVICDGTNGTPDLRDKFVIGAGLSYAVGATGGDTSTTLTQSNLPNVNFNATVTDPGHNHSVNFNDPGHFHSLPNLPSAVAGSALFTGGTPNSQSANQTGNAFTGITVSNNSASTGISVSVASGGSGTAISTLSPYYALAFIMKS